MNLKRLLIFFIFTLSLQSSFAEENVLYLSLDSVPSALAFLPPPPDTNSTQFVADIAQYMWGKSMRKDSARAALAVAQSVHKTDEVLKLFSEPFGEKISKSKTPAIYKLVHRSIKTINQSSSVVKRHYKRKRPYVRFHEPTLVPSEEDTLREQGSYPSGHTVIAYTTALVLIEINPSAQNELLKYAHEWGQSRIIAGYHWQSDVDASKIVVAGVFARLQGNKAFQDDIQKAKEEFAALKKK
ncbi:MAG: phosphatase PAP2 family protein [Fibrobacter sp.]|nr:phosphatase PAP2 family protein [Fibrobacter sp.]